MADRKRRNRIPGFYASDAFAQFVSVRTGFPKEIIANTMISAWPLIKTMDGQRVIKILKECCKESLGDEVSFKRLFNNKINEVKRNYNTE